jgi:hypothetical protein
MDPLMLGNFISALDSFAVSIASNHVQGLKMLGSQFFILTRNLIQFVVRTDLKTSEKEILKQMEKIAYLFFEQFPQSNIPEKGQITEKFTAVLEKECCNKVINWT